MFHPSNHPPVLVKLRTTFVKDIREKCLVVYSVYSVNTCSKTKERLILLRISYMCLNSRVSEAATGSCTTQ